MRSAARKILVSVLSFLFQFAVYLVMEYVPGGTLTAKLKERFSVVATSFYTAQIALALIHLHSHGVLYR